MELSDKQVRVCIVAGCVSAIISDANTLRRLSLEEHERMSRVMAWFSKASLQVPQDDEVVELFLSLAEQTIGDDS